MLYLIELPFLNELKYIVHIIKRKYTIHKKVNQNPYVCKISFKNFHESLGESHNSFKKCREKFMYGANLCTCVSDLSMVLRGKLARNDVWSTCIQAPLDSDCYPPDNSYPPRL